MRILLSFLFILLFNTNAMATNYCTPAYNAIGCYYFQEGRGTTVKDASGQGNTGTFTTVSWQKNDLPSSPYVYNSSSYAGTTGRISLGTTTNLFPANGTAWSMTVKFKLDSTVTGTQPRLVDKSAGAQGPAVQINLPGPVVQFAVAGSTQLLVITSTTISSNVWHDLGISWPGGTTANNVHIYFDKVEASYTTQQNGVTLTSNAASAFLIGNRNLNDAQVWKGSITYMGLFNQVLTAAQFADIADNGLGDLSVITGNSSVQGKSLIN